MTHAQCAKVFFEHAPNKDGRWILVALVKQVLSHLQEIGEQVCLD